MHPKSTYTDAIKLLHSAIDDIAGLANDVGIDAQQLLFNLPHTGVLIKGSDVPVIHKKYRGTCSVILHVNETKQGVFWPFMQLSTFKHGGVTRVFNGLQWLSEQVGYKKSNTTGTFKKQCSSLITDINLENKNTCSISMEQRQQAIDVKEKEAEKKRRRFDELVNKFNNGDLPSNSDAWFIERLAKYTTPTLLSRISVKKVTDGLLFPLQHSSYGHTGFHKIVHGVTGDKKYHFSKKEGVFTGSYIKINGDKTLEQLPIALCEGVATALSLALVWPGEIRVGLSANNLQAVRSSIVKSVVFFCDEDIWKEHIGNVGRSAALNAKRKTDLICGPTFHFSSLSGKPTDFNDLLIKEGIGPLQQQVGDVLLAVI